MKNTLTQKHWLMALVIMLLSSITFAKPLNHEQWDKLLKRHVIASNDGKTTSVDYKGFMANRNELNVYLKNLSTITQKQFDQWSKEEQLAFLINAYNGWTVELILTKYPDLKSIKDLGSFFSSPWKKSFIPLLDDTRSLDNIEHELIRGSGRYNDPRIHFAVNCASIGCPALRAEAYQADKLELQLKEQTILFLSDKTRNRLSGDSLNVSSIFKWYREDFEKGWMGFKSLPAFFIQHAETLGLSANDIKRLQADDLDIDYLDYDWQLNAVKQ